MNYNQRKTQEMNQRRLKNLERDIEEGTLLLLDLNLYKKKDLDKKLYQVIYTTVTALHLEGIQLTGKFYSVYRQEWI